jgi:hypothetical protein
VKHFQLCESQSNIRAQSSSKPEKISQKALGNLIEAAVCCFIAAFRPCGGLGLVVSVLVAMVPLRYRFRLVNRGVALSVTLLG